MTQVLIDHATLEQLVGALESCITVTTGPGESEQLYNVMAVQSAITAGRAAIDGAEPKPMRPQMGVDGFWYDREDTP